jgi:GNAT superfamily N-acetyltransferase
VSKITYRFAVPGDLEALVVLRQAFLAEAGQDTSRHPQVVKATRAFFAESLASGHAVTALAEIKGEPVAACVMIFDRHLPRLRQPTGLSPYIMNMYVRPEYRRLKIATKLLQLLIVRARQAGASVITLHYWPRKSALYEKVGFIRRKREMMLEL